MSTFFGCGHSKSAENSKSFGCMKGCKICSEKRAEVRRKKAQEDRERLGDLMAQARGEGLSTKQIADRFGVSIVTVQRYAPGDTPEITRDPLYHERAIKRAAEIVCSRPDELTGCVRHPRLVRARWAVMLAMRNRGASLARIGRRLGRDHTTVLYGIRKAQHELSRSNTFSKMFQQVDAA